ncbi:MAG: right-handed parallel beta-helix repeat-containing protein [bacterium]
MAFFLGLSLSPSLARAQSQNYFTQFFNEKVLTVSREGDGIFPGTLRAALIQASGIRSQNPFTLVRIAFDPSVKRVRITKGALPEVSGSLTTIDCQTPQGRVLIEGVQENTEGIDPNEEIAGLKLTSNGNAVRNCHITGFRGPGLLIRGNRNTVEYNTIGYHKAVPETAVEASALFEEPKTNQGSGVFLGDGSSENLVQNNEIVGNAFNGVELSGGVGTGNKIVYNMFAKNSGRPIKAAPSANASRQPQITKIVQQGDLYLISGIAEARASLQIYTLGKEDGEIGMIVVPDTQLPQETFTVATKSKGFVPNQTKIVALLQGVGRNSSEFSNPITIPGPNATVIGTPETEGAAPKIEVQPAPKEEPAHEGEGEAGGAEPANAEGGKAPASAATNSNSSAPAGKPAVADKANEPETVINLNGAGEPGHEPDGGGLSEKSAKVSSLGI